MYSEIDRASIPPEDLLRALPIPSLDTVRSERLQMVESDYRARYRWFVWLSMDGPIWLPTFSENRDRFLDSDVARAFRDGVLGQARAPGLLSEGHFTVAGALLEARPSFKGFRRGERARHPPDDPGNPTVNSHGESRPNDSHESTRDFNAQLESKGQGKEAKHSRIQAICCSRICPDRTQRPCHRRGHRRTRGGVASARSGH
jgi:transposase